jgi:hypothetical protein
MEYTGTRYSTKVVSGYNQLSGRAAGMFVSNKLSTQTEADPMATFSNAGARAGVVLTQVVPYISDGAEPPVDSAGQGCNALYCLRYCADHLAPCTHIALSANAFEVLCRGAKLLTHAFRRARM